MRNRSLLCLRFNGHFPSGPGFAGYRNVCVLDFIAAKGRVLEVVSNNNWSYKMCKAPVKMSPSTNQHPVFTGRMPFLSPNQQCQSTEGKVLSIHSVFQNWWFGGRKAIRLSKSRAFIFWQWRSYKLCTAYEFRVATLLYLSAVAASIIQN